MLPFMSEAYAQDAGGGSAAGGQILQYLPLVLIFVVFYFLMIRPQQQQQKVLKAQIAAVKRGDRVLTAGGIVGVVQKVRDANNELEVEIAPNVRVTIARDTLSMILTPSTPAAANDSK
jgi:preprotein translocase subunit YajC